MGLSSKQVNRDGLGWNQNLLQPPPPKPPTKRQQNQSQSQNQQSEPLKCPRCDSSNTKFCYYNNYNKSQPRHFCRACKRHWTKGGTLRNVPVGGGRKNKRPKKSTSTTAAATANTTGAAAPSTSTTLPLLTGDQEKRSAPEIFYQALIRPSSSLPQQDISSYPNQNLQFPFSSSSLFEPNLPVSNSFQPAYTYGEGFRTSMAEPTVVTSVVPASISSTTQPWLVPSTTSSGMDMSNYWNWEEIDNLVSTDINLPWEDDSDIKP
ncbi:hypothetical protein UlMin_018466 [Ulmus minor]